MPHANTEDQLVEQPAIQLFATLGWGTVSASDEARGPGAVRSALTLAYAKSQSMLFVHEHAHKGKPRPSQVDLDCWKELIPNFWHVRPWLPHGGLILSDDNAMGIVWVPHQLDVCPISKFTVVGRHLQRWSEEEYV